VKGAPHSPWRVFPWDPGATEGTPFSASFVPATQGSGRFDLPDRPAGVLYLAETPEHALGEKIQDLRNQSVVDADLFEAGHRYARVSVDLPDAVRDALADLCDPATVARWSTPPDHIAALDRATTQAIAARLYAEDLPGFRWWSPFFGEWHTLVLFRDRFPAPPTFGTPEPIGIDHPVLRRTAAQLGMILPA
jgi:hypothetical protein